MSARQRIVVSRGDRYDVAEWAPGEPEWFGSAAEVYRPSNAPTVFAVIALALAVVGTVLLLRHEGPTLGRPLVATVADLQAVHAGVNAGSPLAPVRRTQRLSAGDAVETDADGRARLRLDDGTAVVVDHDTRLAVREGGIAVERGRVFVLAVAAARTSLDVGGAEAIVSGADVGVDRTGAAARVYVASGEITVRAAAGGETRVGAGETATVAGGKVTVAPERGYDDWTGGMATPWGASGAPRRSVGELWGRASDAASAGDAGSPLTLRAHDVRAVVTRELAETETQTTFFNAGSATVSGDFRMALPPGAIVSRFAVKRGESVSEGHVALAARNQSAAAPSAEVLEWAGEGWVRGNVPAIAPGQAVTVIVGYAEWLAPRPRAGGGTLLVQYRYPMAGGGDAPPLVGEFSARVDAEPSHPISMAAGLGARVVGQAVEVRRPDFRPTADLVVDVEIPAWKAKGGEVAAPAPARLYAVSAELASAWEHSPARGDDDAGGTVLVRTEAPVAAGDDAGRHAGARGGHVGEHRAGALRRGARPGGGDPLRPRPARSGRRARRRPDGAPRGPGRRRPGGRGAPQGRDGGPVRALPRRRDRPRPRLRGRRRRAPPRRARGHGGLRGRRLADRRRSDGRSHRGAPRAGAERRARGSAPSPWARSPTASRGPRSSAAPARSSRSPTARAPPAPP